METYDFENFSYEEEFEEKECIGRGNFGAAFYGLPPAPPPPPMQDGVPMAFAWAMPVSAATTAHNNMNAVELT